MAESPILVEQTSAHERPVPHERHLKMCREHFEDFRMDGGAAKSVPLAATFRVVDARRIRGPTLKLSLDHHNRHPRILRGGGPCGPDLKLSFDSHHAHGWAQVSTLPPSHTCGQSRTWPSSSKTSLEVLEYPV